MRKKYRKSEKGYSDLPVIFVALGAAMTVMVLVSLFLVYLPNRKITKILNSQYQDFHTLLTEKEMIAKDRPKYENELKQMDRDIERLGIDFLFRPLELKKEISQTFSKQNFKLDEFHVGSSEEGYQKELNEKMEEPFWVTYPIDFAISGPIDNLPDLIRNWRKSVPFSLRLQEVDVQRQKESNQIYAVFQWKGYYLIPLEDHPIIIQVQSISLPPPKLFESSKMRKMRQSIQEQEKEINQLNQSLGELSQYPLRKRRLQAVLVRKAKFAAMREQEFDLLEFQLRSALKKVNEKDVQQIYIKVKEVLIATEDPLKSF